MTARTLTHTHPDPHAPCGDSPRPAELRARTPSGCHTLAPAPRRVRSRAPPAARRRLPFQTVEMRGPLLGWPWAEAAAAQSSSSSRSRSPDQAGGLRTRARGALGAARPGGGGVIPQPRSDSGKQPRLNQLPAAGKNQAPGGGVNRLTPPRPSPSQPFLAFLPAQSVCGAGCQGNLCHPLPGNSTGRTRLRTSHT
jgi:hypothetical protein